MRMKNLLLVLVVLCSGCSSFVEHDEFTIRVVSVGDVSSNKTSSAKLTYYDSSKRSIFYEVVFESSMDLSELARSGYVLEGYYRSVEGGWREGCVFYDERFFVKSEHLPISEMVQSEGREYSAKENNYSSGAFSCVISKMALNEGDVEFYVRASYSFTYPIYVSNKLVLHIDN